MVVNNNQLVKSSVLAEIRGDDQYKRSKDTKEHVVVDTLSISLRGQVTGTLVPMWPMSKRPLNYCRLFSSAGT